MFLATRAVPDVGADAAFVNAGPLRWVARHESKPGRSSAPPPEVPPQQTWLLHATPEWTAAHAKDAPSLVARELSRAFLELPFVAPHAAALEPDLVPIHTHSWEFADSERALDAGALWDPALALGACGDWACGSKIEGAWTSGARAGERVREWLAERVGQAQGLSTRPSRV